MKPQLSRCNGNTESSLYIDTNVFCNMVKSWGISLVGVGDVSEGLAREFRFIPVAVSLAIAHPPAEEGIIKNGPVTAYTNQFPLIDARLERIQEKVCSYLRSLGWKAFLIPPDTDKEDLRFAAKLFPLFPHKTAATCAGLGWIGKNGLLVTQEHGARLSWATVLTDAPLETCRQPYISGMCGDCQLCRQNCPAGAISGQVWTRAASQGPLIDVKRCSRQMAVHYKTLGKYICGHCIVACPLGGRTKTGTTRPTGIFGGEVGTEPIKRGPIIKN